MQEYTGQVTKVLGHIKKVLPPKFETLYGS